MAIPATSDFNTRRPNFFLLKVQPGRLGELQNFVPLEPPLLWKDAARPWRAPPNGTPSRQCILLCYMNRLGSNPPRSQNAKDAHPFHPVCHRVLSSSSQWLLPCCSCWSARMDAGGALESWPRPTAGPKPIARGRQVAWRPRSPGACAARSEPVPVALAGHAALRSWLMLRPGRRGSPPGIRSKLETPSCHWRNGCPGAVIASLQPGRSAACSAPLCGVVGVVGLKYPAARFHRVHFFGDLLSFTPQLPPLAGVFSVRGGCPPLTWRSGPAPTAAHLFPSPSTAAFHCGRISASLICRRGR